MLRDFFRLWRASGALAVASRLERLKDTTAAVKAYEDAIRRLDEIGTIRSGMHVSLRVHACGGLAQLLADSDKARATALAREVLDLCARAPRNPRLLKWQEWARAFLA